MLLDVAASQDTDDLGRLADDLGVSNRARMLAGQAKHSIYYSEWRGGHWRAHAAGLLRDGWSPGDPVVRL